MAIMKVKGDKFELLIPIQEICDFLAKIVISKSDAK